MYSNRTVAGNLARILPNLSFKPHFTLIPANDSTPLDYASNYSDLDTQSITADLMRLYDPDLGRPTRDLTPDEKTFIENLPRPRYPKFSIPHTALSAPRNEFTETHAKPRYPKFLNLNAFRVGG